MNTPTLYTGLTAGKTTSGFLAACLLVVTSVSTLDAADYTWIGTGSSASWNVADNWTKDSPFTGYPDASGVSVLISKPSLGANQTISLNQTISIGRLEIGNTVSGSIARRYTIAAGTSGVLNFTSYSSGNAQLHEVAGAVAGDYITAPITLSASLDITNASDFTINLTGGMTSATTGLKSINLQSGKAKITDIGNGLGTVEVNHSSGTLLTIGGANTYTGNTTITNGTLLLESTASLTFQIGDNHVNNAILGAGIVTLDGTFVFDLVGAAAADGNSWQIVDVATLTESYGSTFSVQGFTETSSGIWSLNGYTFTEANGLLTYAVPEPGIWMLMGFFPVLLFIRRRKVGGAFRRAGV